MKAFYVFMAVFSAWATILTPVDIFTAVNAGFFCYWVYRIYEIEVKV